MTLTDIVQVSHYFGITLTMVLSAMRNLRLIDDARLAHLSEEVRSGKAESLKKAMGLESVAVESDRGAFRRRLLGLVFEAARERRSEADELIRIASAMDGPGALPVQMVKQILAESRTSERGDS